MTAEPSPGEWAEWEDFVAQYSQGRIGRTEVPALPKVIERVRNQVAAGTLVPQVCDLDTPHPTDSKEVSQALAGAGMLNKLGVS